MPASQTIHASGERHEPLPLPPCVALVLQGGGALGSYQGGVFEELELNAIRPGWVAGISIGAVNAALIAGNPPEKRVAAIKAFWKIATGGLPGFILPENDMVREWAHLWSAGAIATFGVPGFFRPNWTPPFMAPKGSAESVSFYDTQPLAKTLNDLVDWDLLNNGPVRVSIGAVDVESGNFVFFDNRAEGLEGGGQHVRIDVRHIMASGALPPGFPAVEIDGRHYWDGGIVSNTPLGYIIENQPASDMLVFQVDLFPAAGPLPQELSDVWSREKDIRFSSRTRQVTDQYIRQRREHETIRRLLAKLPKGMDNDPDVAALRAAVSDHAVNVVHLIYKSRAWQTGARDFEFSSQTSRDNWRQGRDAVRQSVMHGDVLARNIANGRTAAFDLGD